MQDNDFGKPYSKKQELRIPILGMAHSGLRNPNLLKKRFPGG
jgi:hypothetical protein